MYAHIYIYVCVCVLCVYYIYIHIYNICIHTQSIPQSSYPLNSGWDKVHSPVLSGPESPHGWWFYLLAECCPLQGFCLYRITQIFSAGGIQKSFFDHCSWIWVYDNLCWRLDVSLLSFLGLPYTSYRSYRLKCWYSNFINHPPVITIFTGGMFTINLMGGLWHCYTHIAGHTGHTFLSPCRSPRDLALCRSPCHSRGPLKRQRLQMSVAPHTHVQRDWNRGLAEWPLLSKHIASIVVTNSLLLKMAIYD